MLKNRKNKIDQKKKKVVGKFVVIDGIDGTGKATQAALLVRRLKRDGVRVKAIDFPNYYQNFFGKLLGNYLSGKYGDFIEVDPHIASVLYAADRFESSPKIKQWLREGYIVVADRYVSANQIHQGGKIDDDAERTRFVRWIEQMEYKVFQIPRPDLILYLNLPANLAQKLLKTKMLAFKKRYTEGRKDVAEDNLLHLVASRRSALSLAKRHNNWREIECHEPNDGVKSREQIHELVYAQVRQLLA